MGGVAPVFEFLRDDAAGGRYGCNVWHEGIMQDAGSSVACRDPELQGIKAGTSCGY